jgi:hypothetical protein
MNDLSLEEITSDTSCTPDTLPLEMALTNLLSRDNETNKIRIPA